MKKLIYWLEYQFSLKNLVAIICFVLIESGNILRLSLSSVNLTFRGTMVGRAGIGYKAKKSNAILFSISDSFLIFDLDFIEISCICTKANALYANNL